MVAAGQVAAPFTDKLTSTSPELESLGMATADATDVSEGEGRPKAALPWEGRLLLTLALLALYYFGHRLKLPFVNAEGVAGLEMVSRFSLLNLGYTGL